MKAEFKKDYYQETIMDKNGECKLQDGYKGMYRFSIHEAYFCENKVKVLKMAIADLEDELNRLKEIDKKNDELMERWDSISK